MDNKECYSCHGFGHIARDCPWKKGLYSMDDGWYNDEGEEHTEEELGNQGEGDDGWEEDRIAMICDGVQAKEAAGVHPAAGIHPPGAACLAPADDGRKTRNTGWDQVLKTVRENKGTRCHNRFAALEKLTEERNEESQFGHKESPRDEKDAKVEKKKKTRWTKLEWGKEEKEHEKKEERSTRPPNRRVGVNHT